MCGYCVDCLQNGGGEEKGKLLVITSEIENDREIEGEEKVTNFACISIMLFLKRNDGNDSHEAIIFSNS